MNSFKKSIAGIYVLDFNTHIKIGRSKNIYNRVKQYNGYRDENQVKKLLFVITDHHHYIEKQSHNFAQTRLPRVSRYEKFICDSPSKKLEFIESYKKFLNTHHSDKIKEFIESFEPESEVEVI
jgi:hypothetical protein